MDPAEELSELFIGAATEAPDETFPTAAELLNQPPEYYLIPDEEIEDA